MIGDDQHWPITGNLPLDMQFHADQPADLPVVPVRKSPRQTRVCPDEQCLDWHQRQGESRETDQDRSSSEPAHGCFRLRRTGTP